MAPPSLRICSPLPHGQTFGLVVPACRRGLSCAVIIGLSGLWSSLEAVTCPLAGVKTSVQTSLTSHEVGLGDQEQGISDVLQA